MDERSFSRAEMPPDHRQILPDRSMSEKLPDKRIPIRLGRREEHDARRKPVDAVYDEGLSSRTPQARANQRECGGRIRVFHGNRRESGRFIDSDDSVILVKHFHRRRASVLWRLLHLAGVAILATRLGRGATLLWCAFRSSWGPP